ncbi:MAG: IS200/IS605 family transposase [Planctomycetota bacterium]|nr:IS200/IS605 family transposase [Planctomycetota bacterium]
MPRNVYSEINLHIVWHTKNSCFLIKPDMEQTVYDYIRRRAIAPGEVFIHEIGGTANHVHIAVTIPPTIPISEWIGQVKGGSSHDLNELAICSGDFHWQTGYGVVSFGTKELPWVKEYIQNQKRHHDRETWQKRLERITRLDA